MKFYLICILIFVINSLSAEIAVLSVNGTTASNCSGSASLRLTGNAGPFHASIVETGAVFDNVQGDILISGLCAGSYTVLVSTSQFPGCIKMLKIKIVLISTMETIIGNSAAQLLGTESEINRRDDIPPLDKNKGFKIYPNPSQGEVHLVFEKMNDYPIELSIYSEAGLRVFFKQLPINTEQFTCNLSGLASGVYFVIVKQEDETFLRKPLVLKL